MASGNARVSGDACVCEDALVDDNAQIYGDALICGHAHVSGDAHVCGNALVKGTAEIKQTSDLQVFFGVGSKNDCLTAYRTKDGGVELASERFQGSLEEFRKATEQSYANYPRVKRSYELLLEEIKVWFDLSDSARHQPFDI